VIWVFRCNLARVNPRTVRWQAGVSFLLLCLTAGVVGPRPVFWLAGLALLFVLSFNVRYSWELGKRGRSERRMTGDRWVARFLAAGLLLPLLIALLLFGVGYNPEVRVWDFTVNETASLVIGVAVLFVLIICSSVVDWYYVRPRIDGVLREPPCRSSGSADWKITTRWWYVHRGVATLAYFGFALLVSFVVMIMLVREHPAAAGVIGGVGGIISLLLIFAGNYRAQFPSVGQFILSPAFCLGDDLTYENSRGRDGRGFVLHVAIPVVKLVPLDNCGLPTTGTPFVERKNSDLGEADLDARPTIACAGTCARLNPECVTRHQRLDQRRRLVIL
jgi:hypothetical protein